MSSTSAFHDNAVENLAKPYAVLDDKTPFKLPFPKTQSGQIMAPAQAVRSSVADMLKYASALLTAHAAETSLEVDMGSSAALKDVSKQLSSLICKQPLETPFLHERSYALGLHRYQLPQRVTGASYGSGFAQPPILIPGPVDGTVLLYHSGSVAGYTSILALLPERDSAIFVAVNALALGDPCEWIAQMLIDAVISSHGEPRNDFVALAKDAAAKHALREVNNEKALEDPRIPNTQHRPLRQYEGDFIGLGGLFKLRIRLKENDLEEGEALEVLFQGLESQSFLLKHYHQDTFTWLESFNDQARRARFNLAGHELYKLVFKFSGCENDSADQLCWMHEPGLPESKQIFVRVKRTVAPSSTVAMFLLAEVAL